jgi:hypothetical protein
MPSWRARETWIALQAAPYGVRMPRVECDRDATQRVAGGLELAVAVCHVGGQPVGLNGRSPAALAFLHREAGATRRSVEL